MQPAAKLSLRGAWVIVGSSLRRESALQWLYRFCSLSQILICKQLLSMKKIIALGGNHCADNHSVRKSCCDLPQRQGGNDLTVSLPYHNVEVVKLGERNQIKLWHTDDFAGISWGIPDCVLVFFCCVQCSFAISTPTRLLGQAMQSDTITITPSNNYKVI